MQDNIPSKSSSNSSVSALSTEAVSEQLVFPHSMELDASTAQPDDFLQADSVTEPVARSVAECSSAQVLPAGVAQPVARDLIVGAHSIGRDRGTKRRGQTANSVEEGKKQKVLQWLEAVEQHRCPNVPCAKCGRRGNWCILGSVSKNVFTYVSWYKKNLMISESGVEALAKIIHALE